MVKTFVLSMMLTFFSPAFAQTVQPLEHQMTQPVIINGEQVEGVTLVRDGEVEKTSCPAPQSYKAVNDSSSGWACFDESSGIWLLHASAPASTTIYESDPQYYGYYGYPYSYPYPYYPYRYGYSYPFGFYGGPAFGFGFGFGHGHSHSHDHFDHGHFHGGEHFGGGHFEHGPHGDHGPGGFHGGGGGHGGGHGGGGHGGGGHGGGRH